VSRRVLEILGAYAPRMFRWIALQTLARVPEAAPDLAERFLPTRIAAAWCREEYGRLARAWFGRLPAEWQREIFGYIQSSSVELLQTSHASSKQGRSRRRPRLYRDIIPGHRVGMPGCLAARPEGGLKARTHGNTDQPATSRKSLPMRPSTHGTSETCQRAPRMSGLWGILAGSGKILELV